MTWFEERAAVGVALSHVHTHIRTNQTFAVTKMSFILRVTKFQQQLGAHHRFEALNLTFILSNDIRVGGRKDVKQLSADSNMLISN